jgi:thioredoxin reductase (NADPH)
MRRLTLYARPYCHLCEDMVQALVPYQRRYGFEVDVVDIDRDERLEALYGEKVPVLTDGQEELCHYFLDEAALQRCLDRPAP